MNVYRSKKAQKNILTTYDLLLQEWKVPVKEIDVPTQYGLTHVNVCGNPSGDPLILFHGVGDDSALMWIYNIKALSDIFCVYAVDTIGGPGKSIPDSNYNRSFDDAVWIDNILDYLHLQQVNLMGVSHGGYLAQYYTLTRWERVRKSVCLAATVPVSTGGSPMKTMMKIFLPEALLPTRKNITKLIIKLTGKNSGAFTDNELIMSHFTYLLRGYNNMAMGYHKTPGFSDDDIDLIRDKCLYLIGEEDPFVLLGGKEMQLKYNMHTIFFPEAGHGINHETPQKINQLAIDYFTKN